MAENTRGALRREPSGIQIRRAAEWLRIGKYSGRPPHESSSVSNLASQRPSRPGNADNGPDTIPLAQSSVNRALKLPAAAR